MAITEIIDESLFISRFEDFNRVDKEDGKGGNFTYRGLRALFAYLDDLSEDTGQDIRLDVIALCCDYAEYKNIGEYWTDYGNEDLCEEWTGKKDLKSLNDEEITEFKACLENHINDKTTLIKFSDDLDEGFIIAGY